MSGVEVAQSTKKTNTDGFSVPNHRKLKTTKSSMSTVFGNNLKSLWICTWTTYMCSYFKSSTSNLSEVVDFGLNLNIEISRFYNC